MKISVIGAGAWGTALSIALTRQGRHTSAQPELRAGMSLSWWASDSTVEPRSTASGQGQPLCGAANATSGASGYRRPCGEDGARKADGSTVPRWRSRAATCGGVFQAPAAGRARCHSSVEPEKIYPRPRCRFHPAHSSATPGGDRRNRGCSPLSPGWNHGGRIGNPSRLRHYHSRP